MLSLDGVTKVFRAGTFGGTRVPAVTDVSFAVAPGEVVSLIGESGSGKTTVGRLVLRLTDPSAGAITCGKTNTPEFGAGSQTFNEVFGATRNPFDLSKTCGGSSGGAAVALALGMVPIADGSDTGGSLRNPAAFCNVVGFRPSPGRVPSPESAARRALATTLPERLVSRTAPAGSSGGLASSGWFTVTSPSAVATMRSALTGRLRVWRVRNREGVEETLRHRARVVADEPEAICRAALMGLGVAMIAMPTVERHLQSGALLRLLPGWYADLGAVSIYFASQKLLPAKTRAFVDHVTNAFREQKLARRFSAEG